MNSTKLVLFSTLFFIGVVGCGAEECPESDGETPSVDLDGHFNAAWSGDASLTTTGAGRITRPTVVTIATNAAWAEVSGLCPGQGPLVVSGNGTEINNWPGGVVCMPTVINNCESATLRLSHVLSVLLDSKSLYVVADAEIEGCGLREPATYFFHGSH